MLNVKYTRPFLKQFKKLSPDIKSKTKKAIKKFIQNPKDSSLGAHKLNGELENFYAFSVDYKFRVIFEMDKQKGVVDLLKVGGHEIYK